MSYINGTAASLRRREDWPNRLSSFLSARRHLPYAYGANDCAGWVLDWTLESTGVDLMPGVKRAESAVAAAKFLLSRGHRDIEGLAFEVLGSSLSSPRLARRGDIVSFHADGEMHLAIVAGASAATPANEGLAWVPRAFWVNGWKLG